MELGHIATAKPRRIVEDRKGSKAGKGLEKDSDK